MIIAALVTGTMLVLDAWFDVVTDSTTRDLIISAVTAAFGELLWRLSHSLEPSG